MIALLSLAAVMMDRCPLGGLCGPWTDETWLEGLDEADAPPLGRKPESQPPSREGIADAMSPRRVWEPFEWDGCW